MENINYESSTISEIAHLVKTDWTKMSVHAKPYVVAMSTMEHIDDNYGCERGDMIIRYFLSSASTWRGEVARSIKKELNNRLK